MSLFKKILIWLSVAIIVAFTFFAYKHSVAQAANGGNDIVTEYWKLVGGFLTPYSPGRIVKLTNIASTTPVGINGGTYYDTLTNKFRCYQNGAWADCIGSSGGGSGTISTSTTAQIGKVAIWTGLATLGNGVIIDNGTVAGIGATSSTISLNIQGSGTLDPFNVASSTGVSVLRVTANQRVGIGSTTPTATLVVQSTSTSPTLNIFTVASSSNTSFLTVAANGSTTLSSLATAGCVNSTSAGALFVSTCATGSLTSFAGMTGPAILVATGTAGNIFNVSTSTNTITFNLPLASASNTGQLSATDWTTFNNKQATISVTAPITLTGASVGIVNQGTTAQVLHGNAAGNASFGAIVNADITNGTIDLTTKVTGILPIANGGTATSTFKSGSVIYYNGTTLSENNPALFWNNSSQFLGDGTSSPWATLTVQGKATSTTSTWLLDIASSSGASYLMVSNGGNVGIGNTNPSVKLDVGVTKRFLVSPDYAGLGELPPGVFFGGTGLTSSDGQTIVGSADGTAGAKLVIGYFNVGGSTWRSALEVANVASGFSNLLLMRSGGNVGIGTTTPGQSLVVVGSTTVTSLGAGCVNSTATGGLYVATCSSGGGSGTISTSTTAQIGRSAIWTGLATLGNGSMIDNGVISGINASSSTVTFNIQGNSGAFDPFNVASSSGTSFLTVKQSGRVGIGTTSPSQLLSVGTANAFTVDNSGNATTTGNLTLTQMMSGSVPFFGTGGIVSQTANNFYWDNTNKRISIGNQVGIVSPQNMTSNTTPAPFVASASGGTAYLAFAQSLWSTPWSNPQFLKIDMGTVTVVGSYQFYSGQGTNNKAVSWTLQGSNDDVTYTVIDTETGQAFDNIGTPKSYTLSANQSYRYYKLNITANNGDASVTVINFILNGNTNLASAKQQIFTTTAGEIGQIIQAASSQTADLQEFQNSSAVTMTVFNNLGYLGIGTSTPTALLALQGTSGYTGQLFDIASSSGASYFHVTAAGNVGIGTVTPNSLLQVAGQIQTGIASSVIGSILFDNNVNSFTVKLTVSTTTASYNLILPTSTPVTNGILVTNSSGQLSFVAADPVESDPGNGLGFNPSNGTLLFDEFFNSINTSGSIGALGWQSGAITGSISLNAQGFYVLPNSSVHPGLVQINTGASATGLASISQVSTQYFAAATTTYMSDVFVASSTSAAQDFKLCTGFSNTSLGCQNPSAGVYFTYASTSPNWVLNTAAASVHSVSTSTIAVSTTTWTTLKIIINGDGSNAEFFVNGVDAGGITTNIPKTSSSMVGPYFGIDKVAGATSIPFYVDYFYEKQVFTTSR